MNQKLRTIMILMIDLLTVFVGYLIVFVARAGTSITIGLDSMGFYTLIPVAMSIYFVSFLMLKIHKSLLWGVSVDSGLNIVFANILATSILLTLWTLSPLFQRTPLTILLMSFFIITLVMEFNHFHYRILKTIRRKLRVRHNHERILIYGAGSAGRLTLKELEMNEQYHYRIIGFIDDDPSLKGLKLNRFPILGDGSLLKVLIQRYRIDHVIIAIQNTDSTTRKQIMNSVFDTGVKNVSLMSSFGLNNPKHEHHALRKVEIQDLLNRDSVNLDVNHISECLRDQSIFVSGAGGSIGSELVRQIVKYHPRRVLLYDISETGLYQIEQEILIEKRRGSIASNIEILAVVGSIRDKEKLRMLFNVHQYHYVFHAAAYKHVPLMETSPREAVCNNIFGTKRLIDVSIEFGVNTFVNISTDKAVNPTNVMGATKRFIEMMMHSERCMKSQTRFVAVRFGNVLGSNGSVIPLFQKQIEEGGPVTVTDPNVVRYFMTIPEAVSLVLQASMGAQGGEIFVLDMGEPVKIKDLAEKMIRLSGYELGKDIEIRYVGLRPGEKLYEELLMDEEGLRRTSNDLIFVAEPKIWEDTTINAYLEILERAALKRDPNGIKEALRQVVQTYVFDE